MKKYNVYEQRRPIREGDEYLANLVRVGAVEAIDGSEAIDLARAIWKLPIVEAVSAVPQ